MSTHLQKRRRRKYLNTLGRIVALKTGMSRSAARQTLLALEAQGEIQIDSENKRVLLLSEEVGKREDMQALFAADPEFEEPS
jgi:hypothetical protein